MDTTALNGLHFAYRRRGIFGWLIAAIVVSEAESLEGGKQTDLQLWLSGLGS